MFELTHHAEPDNFDARRYHYIPRNVFFFNQHANYLLFMEAHRAEFFAARSLLADETSRQLFDQLVLFRLLGHLHVRLPFNMPAARNYRTSTDAWKVEDTADTGLLGPLSIFAVPIEDDVICLKCWDGNVAAGFIFHQYFFRRDGVTIAPVPGDHAVDFGGCFGDTALVFARAEGASVHVYTFDPMPAHCSIMGARYSS